MFRSFFRLWKDRKPRIWISHAACLIQLYAADQPQCREAAGNDELNAIGNFEGNGLDVDTPAPTLDDIRWGEEERHTSTPFEFALQKENLPPPDVLMKGMLRRTCPTHRPTDYFAIY